MPPSRNCGTTEATVAVRLENLTDRPVLLDLPSGRSLRLSPRDGSPRLSSAEVRGSGMVEKLVRRGILAVHDETPPAPPPAGRPRGRRAEPAASPATSDSTSAAPTEAAR
jgi:hypothetical protein